MASFVPCTHGCSLHQLLDGTIHRYNIQSIPRWRAYRLGDTYLAVRNGSITTTGRMRNKGGFHLPPRVPSDTVHLRRAIQLLGHYTQRKMTKQATCQELEALVGSTPPSREVAQQWKAMLQKKVKLNTPEDDVQPFKHRDEILQNIFLPETNESTGRCFVLLGCLERRYRLDQPASPRVLGELTRKIGSYPQNESEAHHYIRALKFLQRERRSKERKPPRIPTNFTEMYNAKMLLGTFSVKGRIGKQTKRLEELVGTIPRNRNVATSWKKLVGAAIRKKRRRDRVLARRKEIEHKRMVRRLRKQKRALELAIAASAQSGLVDIDAKECAKEGVESWKADQVKSAFPTGARTADSHRKTKLLMIFSLFSRLFRR